MSGVWQCARCKRRWAWVASNDGVCPDCGCTEGAEIPDAPSAVFQAAKELNAEISGMSWNGFNLFGDRRSIRELERLMNCEARMLALEIRLDGGIA